MENRIGFGRRLGAFMIDFLIIAMMGIWLVFLIPNFLESLVDWSKVPENQLSTLREYYGNNADYFMLISPAILISSFIYNLSEGFFGFTLGKLMLDIRIGKANGTKANIKIFMLRFAFKNVSTIFQLIAVAGMYAWLNSLSNLFSLIIFVGCLFVLGEKKLAFHDMLAKTAVYKKKFLTKNIDSNVSDS